jgi:hypothetical protein
LNYGNVNKNFDYFEPLKRHLHFIAVPSYCSNVRSAEFLARSQKRLSILLAQDSCRSLNSLKCASIKKSISRALEKPLKIENMLKDLEMGKL